MTKIHEVEGGENVAPGGTYAVEIESADGLSSEWCQLDNLPGSVDPDDFPLLLGRAGGQVQIGGTGAGDDYEVQSTSHGTKGFVILAGILFVDDVNNRIGLNHDTPQGNVHVGGSETFGGTGGMSVLRLGSSTSGNHGAFGGAYLGGVRGVITYLPYETSPGGINLYNSETTYGTGDTVVQIVPHGASATGGLGYAIFEGYDCRGLMLSSLSFNSNKGHIDFAPNRTPSMRLTIDNGNLLLGTQTEPTGGGNPVFVLADAVSDPTGLPANSCAVYSKSGEGYMADAAGNATLQTPHSTDIESLTNEALSTLGLAKPEKLVPFGTHTEQKYLGAKVIGADSAALLILEHLCEHVLGVRPTLLKVEEFDPEINWEQVHQTHAKQQQEAQQEWDSREKDYQHQYQEWLNFMRGRSKQPSWMREPIRPKPQEIFGSRPQDYKAISKPSFLKG